MRVMFFDLFMVTFFTFGAFATPLPKPDIQVDLDDLNNRGVVVAQARPIKNLSIIQHIFSGDTFVGANEVDTLEIDTGDTTSTIDLIDVFPKALDDDSYRMELCPR